MRIGAQKQTCQNFITSKKRKKRHRPAFKKHNTAQHQCHCRDRGVQKPINSANQIIPLLSLLLLLLLLLVYLWSFPGKAQWLYFKGCAGVRVPTNLSVRSHSLKKKKQKEKNEKKFVTHSHKPFTALCICNLK